jgi:hypothetical protein
MAKTINFGRQPTEKDIEWFVKHVGPRTHYLRYSVGGKGWRFTFDQDNPYMQRGDWYLTVDDEKMLTYWTLVRD